jgi:hypothetical protein
MRFAARCRSVTSRNTSSRRPLSYGTMRVSKRPLDAVADALELHLGALVAHAAVVERMRDGARGVAAHELGDLLVGLDAAIEERMVVGGAEPVDDAVVDVDDQQQVGQGIEHGALAAFAFLELLHQSSAAHQVLHAVAQQVPVDGLGEEVRRAAW